MNVPSGYTALDLVGFTDRGTYSNLTNYVKNDLVHYGGDIWKCLLDDTTNKTPAEGTYWTLWIDNNTTADSVSYNNTQSGLSATNVKGAIDEVSSDIATLSNQLTDEVSTRAKTGVHNFCTQTFAKGNYTSAGFVSNNYVASSKGFALKAGTYILSWTELADHPASILGNYLNIMADETHSTDNNINLGAGNPMTVTVPNDGIYAVQINIKSAGINPVYSDAEIAALNSSLVLKLATDADTTYQPYAKTNVELTQQKFSYKDNGVLGAKNLLPNNAITKVENGVTFTVNSDGSITVSTASGGATANTNLTFNFDLKAGSYVLKSGVNTSAWSKSCLYIYKNNLVDVVDYQGGAFTLASDTVGIACTLRVASGCVISTPITYYPMITLATDPDPTYQPYAKSNKELTDNKAEKKDLTSVSVTGTTNNTGSDITTGTYFYLNGTLVRAKTSIANNATLTSGTNYEVVSAGAANNLLSMITGLFIPSKVLTSEDDMNSIDSGIYYQLDSNMPSNYPADNNSPYNAIVIQFKQSPTLNRKYQIWFSYNTASLYHREFSGTTWKSWKKVTTTTLS